MQVGQVGNTEEHRHENDHHRGEGGGSILRFRWSERLDTVTDRLNPGERSTTSSKGAEQEPEPNRLTGLNLWRNWVYHRLGAKHGVTYQCKDDHCQDTGDEGVGGNGEDRTTLFGPT